MTDLNAEMHAFFIAFLFVFVRSDEAKYTEFRKERDAQLNFPKLLIPSIQVNIDGGRLPQKAEGDKHAHLKWPINVLK